MTRCLLVLMLGCVCAWDAPAATTDDVLPQARALDFIDLDRAEALARYGHPNEMWRYRALRTLKLQQPERAVDLFVHAARHADKFSQHALSLLYWHGVGTEVDRARAYAWADLAAERGYRNLLLVREKMWLQMDATQRERALQLGEAIYAEYGDAAAKPRLARAMRRALSVATGSRLGSRIDRVEFLNAGAIAGLGVAPLDLYQLERWKIDEYWQTEDRQWEGRVLVLPPQKVESPATP